MYKYGLYLRENRSVLTVERRIKISNLIYFLSFMDIFMDETDKFRFLIVGNH